jgi:hypothetical protein
MVILWTLILVGYLLSFNEKFLSHDNGLGENGDKHPKTTNVHQIGTRFSKPQMFSK